MIAAERDAAIATQAVLSDELRRVEERARKHEADASQLTLELKQSILDRKQSSEQISRTSAPFGFKSPFRPSKSGSATPAHANVPY